MTPDDVALRPVVPADRDLLLRIYASSRETEMALVPWTPAEKDAFLREQFEFQDRHYRTAYEGAAFSIVTVRGEDAGRLIVHRGPQWIEVMDIALLGPWRNQGVGTQLIRDLMAEAARTAKSLRLWVEQFNRARHLYARLGFVHAGTEGVHMEWTWTAKGAGHS